MSICTALAFTNSAPPQPSSHSTVISLCWCVSQIVLCQSGLTGACMDWLINTWQMWFVVNNKLIDWIMCPIFKVSRQSMFYQVVLKWHAIKLTIFLTIHKISGWQVPIPLTQCAPLLSYKYLILFSSKATLFIYMWLTRFCSNILLLIHWCVYFLRTKLAVIKLHFPAPTMSISQVIKKLSQLGHH